MFSVKDLSRKEKQQIKKEYAKTKNKDLIPEGYRISPKGSLVKIKSIYKDLTKQEYKELGFKSIKEGKEFVKNAKKKNLLSAISTKAQFKNFVDFVKQETVKETAKIKVNKFLVKQHFNRKSKVDIKKAPNRHQFTNNFLISTPHNKSLDIITFFNLSKYKNFAKIRKFGFPCRMKLVMKCLMIHEISGRTDHAYFQAYGVKEILNEMDMYRVYNEGMDEIENRLNVYLKNKSGWKLKSIEGMYLNLAEYNPFAGSSYIEIPKSSKVYGKVINIQNNDAYCFLYSILCGIHFDKIKHHRERVSHYKEMLSKLTFDEKDFPLPIRKIEKYEDIFKVNIFVFRMKDNVLSSNEIVPEYFSKKNYSTNIDLMFIKKGEQEHYCYIPDLSRLLSGIISQHKSKIFICRRCLTHKYSQEDLDEHLRYCKIGQKIEMPEDETITFLSHHKQVMIPNIIVADIETGNRYNDPLNEEYNEKSKKTKIISTQDPTGICYNVVSKVKDYNRVSLIRKTSEEHNVIRQFLDEIKEEAKQLYKYVLKRNIPMELTDLEEKQFQECNTCHICKKEINEIENPKVRDHDHYTGNYRGVAHNQCNLNYRVSYIIPVVFHNLKGFDSHFIIKQLNETDGEIGVIPVNREKFISFSLKFYDKYKMKDDDGEYILDKKGKIKECKKLLYEIRFIDSLSFLNTSLEKLVASLNPARFYHTVKYIKSFGGGLNENLRKFCMIKRKGIYPYEYIDGISKFEETELPSIDKFYSSLTDSSISKDEYLHAQKVFKEFNCKNLGDYHDLYLLTDVLLLTDVIQNYRKICIEEDGLEPFHYFTFPSYSMDLLLKQTGESIELLSQEDMYLYFESAKRGGVSIIRKRYSKANNPYMSSYDSTKPTKYIMYQDKNSLYGWAMTQKLPQTDFETIKPDFSINELGFDFDKAFDEVDSDYSYYLTVDLHLPEEYHDLHSDYPMFPVHKGVAFDELSDKQKEWLDTHQIKESKVKKLITSLEDKIQYTVHAKMLKLGVQHGWKITKFHKGIKFYQSDFCKSYVDNRMEKRKHAKADFEKDYYKLGVNSPYGKFLEDVRSHINVRIENKNAKKWFNKSNLGDWTPINEDGTYMFDTKKEKVCLDKPIYIGVAICDLAKWKMYDYWYNYLKPLYGDKIKLLMSDTDSLVFEVECEDIYKDMQKSKELFDLSNYKYNHFLYDETNKKKVGAMKDECPNSPIIEFCGVRSKMYSILQDNDKEKKTAKGIPKKILEKNISHQKYKDCIMNEEKQSVDVYNLKSTNHVVKTVKLNKTSLCVYDDKFWYVDGLNSLPYGHFLIPKK